MKVEDKEIVLLKYEKIRITFSLEYYQVAELKK